MGAYAASSSLSGRGGVGRRPTPGRDKTAARAATRHPRTLRSSFLAVLAWRLAVLAVLVVVKVVVPLVYENTVHACQMLVELSRHL